MGTKVYTFDEAINFIEEFKESQESDIVSSDDLIEDEQDFVRYIQKVQAELNDIIRNESDELELVELELEVIDEGYGFVKVGVLAKYRDFTYDNVLVIPSFEYMRNRESTERWISAFVIRQYRKSKGDL